METTRSVWRSLRPVLLAAAAATTWLALSAPAATASSDTDSPLTKATSSVTALAPAAADPAGDILRPATGDASRDAGEGPAVTSPLTAPSLSPVVHEVTRAADGLLQSVPVVTVLVPAESLTQLTEPVMATADTVVGDTTNSLLGEPGVVPEIVNPTLKPVIDLAGAPGTSPVSGTGLELPLTVDGGTLGSLVPANADQPGGVAEPLTAPDAADFHADVTGAMVPALPRAGVFTSSAPWGQLAPLASADVVPPAYPDGGPLDTLPDFLPAMPGSGSNGGNGPGAGASTPAWLAAHGFEPPLTTALPVLGALLRSPSPVSFDPGSSPD